MRFQATLTDGTRAIIAPNSVIDVIADVLVVNQEGVIENIQSTVIRTPFLNITAIDVLNDEEVEK